MIKIPVKYLNIFNINIDFEEIVVSYNDKIILRNVLLQKKVKEDELDKVLLKQIDYYKTDDEYKLVITNIKITEEDNELYLIFDEKNTDKVIYNLNTKEITEEIKDGNFVDILKELSLSNYQHRFTIQNISMTNIKKIEMFLNDSLKDKNEFVYNTLYNNKEFERKEHTINSLINIYNACISDLGFEKILKINTDFIFNAINNEILEVNNDGKINNVLELPKYVINYINSNNYTDMLIPLQNIKVNDGNDFRILIDFFENSKVLVHSKDRKNTFTAFTKRLSNIYKIRDDYRLKDLLAYLIKESYFNKLHKTKVISNTVFSFPLEEAMLLEDYLRMAKDGNIKSEKFPDLHLEHNIIMKNINVLNQIDQKEFKEGVDSYKDMTSYFKHDDYELLYPESLKSMVDEGTNLHHCVASYASKIIKKESKIFFLRKKENKEESFFTIELDQNNNLNHMRGKFQELPDADLERVVNNWIKNYKKEMAK